MSFFGFDTTLPRDRRHASGLAAPRDAFAGLSDRPTGLDDALDFEDTYDGLADKLDDTADDLNDDTFGDAPVTQQSVGRDFDFSGQTNNVAQAFEEERMRFAAQNTPGIVKSPPKKTTKPHRTGYERTIPQLEADAALWGMPVAPKKNPEPPTKGQASAAARRGMTLEEVEAMMKEQSKGAHAPQPPAPPQMLQSQRVSEEIQAPYGQVKYPGMPGPFFQAQPSPSQIPPLQSIPQPSQPVQVLQRPPHMRAGSSTKQSGLETPTHKAPLHSNLEQLQKDPQPQEHAARPPSSSGPKTVLQRPVTNQPSKPAAQRQQTRHPQSQPRQVLQNPNRLSGQNQGQAVPIQPAQPVQPVRQGHARGSSYHGPIITNPQQILQLSEEDRAAFLHDEARRAKRNHKIQLLSKFNGLMTPQDKNFITRIQLQQLVTATGSVDAQSPEALLNEDFYYQVYAQIRGASRQNPHQPANQFAQTYLFQTGGRYAPGRRHPRGGDNHMQRMEQQVHRAVEAARAKPKNKQLVIEGSLGKISFSNSKTPKPLLSIKRPEGEARTHPLPRRPSRSHDAAAERRVTLKNIEDLYSAVMDMEDQERRMPPSNDANSPEELQMKQLEWHEEYQRMNKKMWNALKVLEPIISNSPTQHPFISLLSHTKGKKAIPRVFRHLDENQRVTVLTMVIVHLDSLDVIANALAHHTGHSPLPLQIREEIDLFTSSVLPPLFSHVNDAAPLALVVGLLGLVLDRCDVRSVVRTKVGVSVLAQIISRIELLKQQRANPATTSISASAEVEAGAGADTDAWALYTQRYDQLFAIIEPVLPDLFPDENLLAADDVHVWQFLAAMGVAASAEQQQRLVIGVKERVMGTVGLARTLPPGEREKRLGEVNLFMKGLGLDVELLAA